jgi:hypothetical protein
MRRLIGLILALVLAAACSGQLPSSRPSLSIQNPIASAPTETPNQQPTESASAQPTKTPKETAEPTEEATAETSAEPTEEATVQPTQEATVEPSPTETAEASESPSAAPGGSTIEIFAGGGGLPPAPGVKLTDAALQRPTGVVVGSIGDSTVQGPGQIYIVDGNLGIELRVAPDSLGTISDVATGLLGPQGIGVEPGGFGPQIPWVADTANNRIVTANGHGGWTAIAGTPNISSYRGDGGPAKRAWLSQPFDVAGPYIADTTNQRVRYIDPATGVITTVAGNGTEGYAGDKGPATDAELANPQAIAVSADGTKLYIADYTNFRIREVDLASDTITTVAGTGDGTAIPYDPKLTGIETPVTRASALAIDPQGNVYFPVFWGDEGTTIMRLAPDGSMTKIAGGGKSATADVGALDFALPDVLGLAIDPFDGSLFICGSDGIVYRVEGVAQPS